MARNLLLEGVAVDYSKHLGSATAGEVLLPTLKVKDPSGRFQTFGKDFSELGDDSLAANGGAAKISSFNAGEGQYHCKDRGYAERIDLKKLEELEGPFAVAEKNSVKVLTGQLLNARDARIAKLVGGLSDRTKIASKKINAEGADVVKMLIDARGKLSYDANTMIIGHDVWREMQLNASLLSYLGDVNLTKIVTEDVIKKLMGIDKLVIAKNMVAVGNRKKGGADLSNPWAGRVTFAYTSLDLTSPRAGNTFAQKLSGENIFHVSTSDERGGLKGVRVVDVTCSTDEKIVCPELVYTLSGLL